VHIEIRFDRYLLPKTAVRQSILLYTGPASRKQAEAVRLQPFYDAVERVVVFRVASGATLLPGLLYHVELISPNDSQSGFGFRAFDEAPLSKENDVPLRFSFFTARADPQPSEPPKLPTCFDAWSALGQSGCFKAGCHTGSDSPMGLRLDSRAGLVDTAIGHVAHEADTGPLAGRPLVDPPRFGTAMPVIDPGSPGTSYLLYKLLVRSDNFGADCTSRYRAPLADGTCLAADDAEQQRLRDWFVRLEPMPFGGTLAGGAATLDLLQSFILAGAETDTCP
jgi:hypothetical protein